jgi:hypothetical protein
LSVIDSSAEFPPRDGLEVPARIDHNNSGFLPIQPQFNELAGNLLCIFRLTSALFGG